MIVGTRRRVEFFDLVLGEIAAGKTPGAGDLAGHRREPPGDKPRESRFAVAVGAEQRDAIVGIEPQVEAAQYRLLRRIADRDLIKAEHRRRELGRLGEGEVQRRLFFRERDRLQPRQRLHPALRLARFRRFGAETIDEGLQTLALVFLARGERLLTCEMLAPRADEILIAAAIKRQAPLAEMKDVVDHLVEELPVMADE